MVYATDITNYALPPDKLEETLLFWMVVAGKEANMMANKLERFLADLENFYILQTKGIHRQYTYRASPFALLRHAIGEDLLSAFLRRVKMGKYTLLEKGFREVVKLDPRTCTLEDLEAVPGIGPKTARCFLMHSRPHQRLAGLDTHLLKFLRACGYDDAPKSTPPSGPQYRKWEQVFLAEADRLGFHDDPATLDLAIWNYFAGRTDSILPKAAA
jgi:hypothetical protein